MIMRRPILREYPFRVKYIAPVSSTSKSIGDQQEIQKHTCTYRQINRSRQR